jgi:hypothetical protein
MFQDDLLRPLVPGAFQLHTNDEYRQDGFGGTGLSWVKQFGPGLAVSSP